MTIPNGPYLDFEKEIVELEQRIAELEKSPAISEKDLESLRRKRAERLEKSYSKLSPWNKVELARRAGRPYTLDYIGRLFEDFVELHGDRAYGDDKAIIGGFAKFKGQTVMVIGQQKGRDTKENVYRNFGMPNPEGYRKALRLMKMAEKFNRPIVTFVDTPGAFPGLGAEERGQGEAIARNLFEMAGLTVPIISIVIGEGASGGALGIAVADRLLMLENAWYSVISPEGCAAILWGDRSKAQDMASKMKLTAADLKELELVDQVVPEPIGGAHWDPESVYLSLDAILDSNLKELCRQTPESLVQTRLQKYSKMGRFLERA